jgi:uncharacterized glyoxalase superfamily protein PhnB
MAKRIDPLNRKQYSAVSPTLTVRDPKSALAFYQKAFGFKKRNVSKGPDGAIMHAELTLRGITLMVGPEMQGFSTSPKTLGGSPSSLYLYVENADKVFAKAVSLGATENMPDMDMFGGDRGGVLFDPEGHSWHVATHIAEPTVREMNKMMKEQMAAMKPPAAPAPAAGTDTARAASAAGGGA